MGGAKVQAPPPAAKHAAALSRASSVAHASTGVVVHVAGLSPLAGAYVHAPASVHSWLLPVAPLQAVTSVVTHEELDIVTLADASSGELAAMRLLEVEIPQTYLDSGAAYSQWAWFKHVLFSAQTRGPPAASQQASSGSSRC